MNPRSSVIYRYTALKYHQTAFVSDAQDGVQDILYTTNTHTPSRSCGLQAGYRRILVPAICCCPTIDPR